MKADCKECGNELTPKEVLYSCPLIYKFYCETCKVGSQIEGEGIKVLTLEEARAKRPEFYKHLEETKLKPCPFCGDKALISDKSDWNFRTTPGTHFDIGCNNPECQLHVADLDVAFQGFVNEEEAKKAWDKRR